MKIRIVETESCCACVATRDAYDVEVAVVAAWVGADTRDELAMCGFHARHLELVRAVRVAVAERQ